MDEKPNNDRHMTGEHKAWLFGVLGVAAAFTVFAIGIANAMSNGDQNDSDNKTKQVEACANIEDSSTAFACVVQIDK